jgi:hypothetical protein
MFIKAQFPQGLSSSNDPYCKASPPFPCHGVAHECSIRAQRENDIYCGDVMKQEPDTDTEGRGTIATIVVERK